MRLRVYSTGCGCICALCVFHAVACSPLCVYACVCVSSKYWVTHPGWARPVLFPSIPGSSSLRAPGSWWDLLPKRAWPPALCRYSEVRLMKTASGYCLRSCKQRHKAPSWPVKHLIIRVLFNVDLSFIIMMMINQLDPNIVQCISFLFLSRADE